MRPTNGRNGMTRCRRSVVTCMSMAGLVFLSVPGATQEAPLTPDQRLSLEEDARLGLEALADEHAPYRAAAERLIETLPQATTISRGSGADVPPEVKENLERGVSELVAAGTSQGDLPPGFDCLGAYHSCEYPWLDCNLVMIVCLVSHLPK